MTTSLDDQVAIITGATSGIGEAVARALDAKGMRLVLCGRRRERLERLVGELGDARALCADITDPAVPGRLVTTAVDAFGRLDVAFNNAGILATGGIDDIDLERMAMMVRLNVEAAYRFAYTVLRHFKAQNRGHLVNTSSVAGVKVRANVGAYSGTKHAIEALAHALRVELADTDVRISNVQPGIVDTEIFDHLPEDMHPIKVQGVDEPLLPGDIARCIVFMLEQPAHVTIPTMLVLPTRQPV